MLQDHRRVVLMEAPPIMEPQLLTVYPPHYNYQHHPGYLEDGAIGVAVQLLFVERPPATGRTKLTPLAECVIYYVTKILSYRRYG